MSPEDSLRRFGTIAFCDEIMKRTIGFGEPVFKRHEFIGFDKNAAPWHLSVAPWILMVPRPFRDAAHAAVDKAYAKMHLQVASERNLEDFRRFIREELARIIPEHEERV